MGWIPIGLITWSTFLAMMRDWYWYNLSLALKLNVLEAMSSMIYEGSWLSGIFMLNKREFSGLFGGVEEEDGEGLSFQWLEWFVNEGKGAWLAY